jgi:hypothetical protein
MRYHPTWSIGVLEYAVITIADRRGKVVRAWGMGQSAEGKEQGGRGLSGKAED